MGHQSNNSCIRIPDVDCDVGKASDRGTLEGKMKALIVYDSTYGNTEQIARAMGGAISGEVILRRADEASASDMEGVDLLIVGSPTQAGRPTKAIQGFLNGFSGPVSVAAFDTRMAMKWAKVFGYAAGRIAKALQGKGGTLVAPPEAFIVEGKEGPLKDGETQRAADWARTVRASRA